MATLQGAIDEFIAVMNSVDGLPYVPDDPVEQVPVWPAAIAYATDGQIANQPPDMARALHNITIALVMPLVDMAKCTQIMLSYAESIPEALFQHRNGRTSEHYATFGDISYTLGPIDWPQGHTYYGFLWQINNVKIHRVME